MEKKWEKPEMSKSREMSMCECTEQEMQEVTGGIKIGACFVIGAGGDFDDMTSGIMLGICYVIGF